MTEYIWVYKVADNEAGFNGVFKAAKSLLSDLHKWAMIGNDSLPKSLDDWKFDAYLDAYVFEVDGVFHLLERVTA